MEGGVAGVVMAEKGATEGTVKVAAVHQVGVEMMEEMEEMEEMVGMRGMQGTQGVGGNAGNGGNCLIQATDPRLLMLVEVDCMQGEPGEGAKGGEGGEGGMPGCGGRGGSGGSGGTSSSSEVLKVKSENYHHHIGDVKVTNTRSYDDGRAGNSGRNGNRGRRGARGGDSRKGEKAHNGGIMWVVWSPDSPDQVTESSTRYDAKVHNFKVVPALDGGIFEPNERITVSGIVVHNTGGLDLPHGATVLIPSTPTVKFEPSRFDIPPDVLKSSKRYTIPFNFHGRIFDLAPPNAPGRQHLKAEFHTRIEVLGRPFEKSFLKQELIVQYPVQLGEWRTWEEVMLLPLVSR